MDVSAPKVFISYSHDSLEHKRWVLNLAADLRTRGVNALLDHWELRLGDDVTKFMERGVRDSERVLMICTESYVRKADDGKGGVGYESMIVTGELVEDLGTAKFIPLIRQSSESVIKPLSMSTRFHIDFSDSAQYEDALIQLVHELHSESITPKPALGVNPFAAKRAAAKNPNENSKVGKEQTEIAEFIQDSVSDVEATYHRAMGFAQRDDMVGWRRLIQTVRPQASEALRGWRSKVEPIFTGAWSEFLPMAKEGVAAYAPLMAIAVAGVESGREKFTNQRSVVDDILYPNNWTRAGIVVLADFPLTSTFVYQGLHGAISMASGQPQIALNLVTSSFNFPDLPKRIPMWSNHGVMGWPKGFSGDAHKSWENLASLGHDWRWLQAVFGDSNEYRAALSAYYMLLNLSEYIEMLSTQIVELQDPKTIRLDIPLCYESESVEVLRRAYSILLAHPDLLRAIWRSKGIRDKDVKSSWGFWLESCEGFLLNAYPYSHRYQITHKDLIADLL